MIFFIKKIFLLLLLLIISLPCFCWGFYAHQKINNLAVFLLPPQMLALYKPNIYFLASHSVDPDKRRYAIPEEGPRHYIDIDKYGQYPFVALPRNWDSAVNKFSMDTVQAYGIVPWWVQTMLQRLTMAFKDKNQTKILKLSAEIGHYIADAHVPLHACSNHNGQYTQQKGIHGFWESRIPELLAEKEWNFFIGKAMYIKNPGEFIWSRILESATAADTVLQLEKQLSKKYSSDHKFAFEQRNGVTVRQYSEKYTKAYNEILNGMVERRMRQSVFAVASFWYTAWVNAGQPNLDALSNKTFTLKEAKEFEQLNLQWKNNKEEGCK